MKAVVRDDTDASKRLLLLHEDVTGPGKKYSVKSSGQLVLWHCPCSDQADGGVRLVSVICCLSQAMQTWRGYRTT